MSVVTIAQYREITRDESTDDATVQTNLDSIEAQVEEFLKRPLERVERTETCLVYPEGRLYPLATPIASVSDPASAIVYREVFVEGATPFYDMLIENSRERDDYATITYIGGWTSSTLPETMKRIIARLAMQLERSATSSSQFPVGATSISLGDASISFAAPTGEAGELDTLLPGATRTLRKWKRRV